VTFGIAFFGMPLGALLLARDGHELTYVALGRDEAPGLRRARRVFGDRAFVRPDVSSPATVARIASTKPSLIVSWFWPKQLPADLLSLAPGIGVHPSLLPRHRGPDPTFWAIESGDEVSGVTAHALDAAYDTGAIFEQVRVPIDPAWNAWTLARMLDRPSLALLRRTVDRYARGNPPSATPQDESRATLAPTPTEDMLELRWQDTAARIARRVRAAAPWPGAFTEIDGETIVLTEVRPTEEFPRVLEPGEATVRPDGVGVIRCANGAVELVAGRREDDDTPLDANALARRLGGRTGVA
jgi:methionyl-tRNA formyltransferase